MLVFVDSDEAAKTYVESEHPREPEGVSEGGRWRAKDRPTFEGKGAEGHFLGKLPVPIGKPRVESKIGPDHLRGFGEAIRRGVERHPELLDGPRPIQEVAFFSELEWGLRELLLAKHLQLATAYRKEWKGVRLLVNDIEGADTSKGDVLIPATRTPMGAMTHELGHAFAAQHGLWHGEGMGQALQSHSIDPAALARLTLYGASSPEEAFAELYAQHFTPGFKIRGQALRTRFEWLIADMRSDDRAKILGGASSAGVIGSDPELDAEVKRAAKENIEAGRWVAKTPLLDELRERLSEDEKDEQDEEGD